MEEKQERLLKITDEMRVALRADFPKEAYKQHPTKTFLTTLQAMYITERLNDVFGIGRWTIKIMIIKELDNYVLVQGEFVSLDYEVITPKQFGGHNTTGKNVELADGYKSAVTDCQSKIASYLEIGIDMFKGKIKGSGAKSDYQKKEQQSVNMPQQDGIITDKQKSFIISVANQSGYTKEEGEQIIDLLGYKAFSEILKQDFDTLLEGFKKSAESWRKQKKENEEIQKNWEK